jgi:Xaa-Pro aminopeptidase
MKLYTFEYFSPVTDTWLTHYAPSEEAVLVARGEYVKYAEEPGWVKGWKVISIKPDAANICNMLNMATEEKNSELFGGTSITGH